MATYTGIKKIKIGDNVFELYDSGNTNYYHTTGSWSGLTYTATANGGAGALAFTIPTGTTSSTVAAGNHTHNYVLWRSDLTSIGSGSPAAGTQTYWTDMLTSQRVAIGYNTSGKEYTLIFSKGSSDNYGSVIKYGYNDLYFYIMRKSGSSAWTDSDWVKMNAGYADSAGSVAWSNVSDKPTIPIITLNGSATTSPSFYAPTSVGTNGYVLKSSGSGAPTWTSATLTDTQVTVAENTKTTKYYPILATGTGTATRQIDTNDKNDSSASASGFWYQNGILCAPAMQAGDWDLTITTAEYNTLVNAISAI